MPCGRVRTLFETRLPPRSGSCPFASGSALRRFMEEREREALSKPGGRRIRSSVRGSCHMAIDLEMPIALRRILLGREFF